MQLTKQAISDIQEFKDWLLEDVQSNVHGGMYYLKLMKSIHLDLGEHLQELTLGEAGGVTVHVQNVKQELQRILM